MGWAVAPETKVARGGDEPISEGPLPEAVGDYPVGEGVVLMSNPVCQGKATVGFRGQTPVRFGSSICRAERAPGASGLPTGLSGSPVHGYEWSPSSWS